ncbi:MAG TPA: hypothetical protein H9786_13265 [Candidatus Brachybacterium merdavium]|uniref:Uncharacterized protein n=1 Tax=Candidatus Brachybacterium merdavium TaxID=2838513 RepID=A0A9D2LF47_9MICO|nr:hypothetical protein [Candidatus Brachybacterium merdavium]
MEATVINRRSLIRSAVLTSVAASAAPAAAALPPSHPGAHPLSPERPKDGRLTNLSHLRFLLAEVPLSVLDGHSTHGLSESPSGLAPWTYADHLEGGGFDPVGGGELDEATGHWTQGAYNADDIARAAIVFLRAHTTFGDDDDLATARGLLRTLTYLQVDSGEFAGNVVLWMQADGTLNRSAAPVELPDPSDSDESYWLARTIWALGEAVPVYAAQDPDFAAFLIDRLHLALGALGRASLGRYGHWQEADGTSVPGWLIADGADATGEAVLGLTAAVQARPRDRRLRRALDRYSEGIEAMTSGDVAEWPYRAILPSTGSQSLWHAWGGLAPAALAAASTVTGNGLEAAVGDAGVFTPQLLTSGGPYNAWSPAPDESQIAYGAQSRVEGLLRTADATCGQGLRELAALAAGWFFGANPSGEPAYDPATGVTIDGIEPDGTVNLNSGAESTIHGLLAMIALDAEPRLARTARCISGRAQARGMLWLPAEDAELSGDAQVITPDSSWTGESNWSGSYALVAEGGSVSFKLEADQREVIDAGGATAHPVIHRLAEDAGTALWTTIDGDGSRTELGVLELGGIDDRGATEWDGILKPFPLESEIPNGTVAIEAVVDGHLELDELMILPGITSAAHPCRGGGEIILRAASVEEDAATVPGETGSAFTADGERLGPINRGRRSVPAGAFAITTR